LHPAENIEKMAHGIPLVEADRKPWLQAIARQISEWRIGGINGVVTCSALRKYYRDIVAKVCPDVGLI
jgi:gluconokinase